MVTWPWTKKKDEKGKEERMKMRRTRTAAATTTTRHIASTSTCWHFAFGACCHSNETRAPIANRSISAQLEDIPTIPASYIRVRAVLWECGEGQTHGQTDTQTRVANIHFASPMRLTRNATTFVVVAGWWEETRPDPKPFFCHHRVRRHGYHLHICVTVTMNFNTNALSGL